MARAGAFACIALSGLSGCDGAVVNLGNSGRLIAGGEGPVAGAAGSSAQSGAGGAREWVPQLEAVLIEPTHSLANPTFSAEADYVLFTRQALGADSVRIWRA